ncbi:MAG: DEAD/DEAH box helicase [Balneolaceae bacterium]|nr:DEAD/DEAH box helicase [Balneolaceae bacterium]
MTAIIKNQLSKLRESNIIEPHIYRNGTALYMNGACQMLSRGKQSWEILVDTPDKEVVAKISVLDEEVEYQMNGKKTPWNGFAVAALLQAAEELEHGEPRPVSEGKAYTRKGMMKRVLAERREKARKAEYKITFADNQYGEHILVNEKGVEYRITLRDFDNETGYIDNPDLKTNKLGTTKHLIFAFQELKSKPELMERMDKNYPFVEIYLDPLYDYKITWHYPHPLKDEIKALINKYFREDSYIPEHQIPDFLEFLKEADAYPEIRIRPEVEEAVQKAWDEKMLATIKENVSPDYSLLKTELFSYQKEGVEFATFRKGAIIADEMGLGKTIQAIATAVLKKEIFDFKKTLVICPASLKEQWKEEVEKFSHEEAIVVEGTPDEREEIYRTTEAYFIIINYETVLRDLHELNRMDADFIILDEAQRIKNFTTVTANTIKSLNRKHALVITGTPIENRLIDLYSIVQFIDPYYLAPLWEFSYQHCFFDTGTRDKITGYYNLQDLQERLKPILIRRERRDVIKELPNVSEITIPVGMHSDQQMYHAGFASGIAKILRKKYITPYEQQRLMLLLNNMRMVCDCTYLIDKETYHSPKLQELKYILLEKLDLLNTDKKIIIFSEWVTMLHLIGKMLNETGIGFARLTGQVAVKNRGKLIKKFETDPDCKVFLSTEAGGSGLNLQVADTVINFELPWNPAKKNQRIGRINRLGQKKKNLTVINLITKASIETKIAAGLNLKQNLFEGVLDSGSDLDSVDFSAKGKAQFLKQLEESITEFTSKSMPSEPSEEPTIEQKEPEQKTLADLIEEDADTSGDEEATSGNRISDHNPSSQYEKKAAEMENVLNKGMDFFSDLFRLSTGKESGLENRRVEIDEETGEVVMRFKIG